MHQIAQGHLFEGRCKCGRMKLPYNKSWCRACRNAHARENRKRHSELPPGQRYRANARSYANVYQRRGLLKPQQCSVCGSTKNLEKHHGNYDSPLDVVWLCRDHHYQLHGKVSRGTLDTGCV